MRYLLVLMVATALANHSAARITITALANHSAAQSRHYTPLLVECVKIVVWGYSETFVPNMST